MCYFDGGVNLLDKVIQTLKHEQSCTASMLSHLSNHAVPNSSDELAMFTIGDKIEVIRELDITGKFLQDVYAKAFTAQFGIRLSISNDPVGIRTDITAC